MKASSDLIETTELASLIEEKTPNLKLLDVSLNPASSPEPGLAEYKEEHLPGAIYFNYHITADKEYPGKIGDEKVFAKYAKEKKIKKNDLIVCYDHTGVIQASRLWFIFKLHGAPNVKVLNGGLAKWKLEGRALEKGDISSVAIGSDEADAYDYKRNPEMLVDIDYINSIIPELTSGKGNIFLLDSRPPENFNGTNPEPIKGMRAGHVKGAINIPVTRFIAGDGMTFKSIEEIKKIFESKGVNVDKRIIGMCMRGVTSCVILFSLWRMGKKEITLYNGNWYEYGLKPESKT